MTATRLSIDFLGDGGAAKEYNVLVIGEATESDADLGDDEQKEEDDVAMKEDDELIIMKWPSTMSLSMVALPRSTLSHPIFSIPDRKLKHLDHEMYLDITW